MSTLATLKTLSAELDPDAPLTLVHITAAYTIDDTGDPSAFTYDYNSITEDFPDLCEAAAAEVIDFGDGCG